jgi:hypothetical protein
MQAKIIYVKQTKPENDRGYTHPFLETDTSLQYID